MIGQQCPECDRPLRGEVCSCGWKPSSGSPVKSPRACELCGDTVGVVLTDEGRRCRACWRGCPHVPVGSRQPCAPCANDAAAYRRQFLEAVKRLEASRVVQTERSPEGGIAL